jgi:uncharacterized delta-60 repeat protein
LNNYTGLKPLSEKLSICPNINLLLILFVFGLFITTFSYNLKAAPGDLDQTFGIGGIAASNAPTNLIKQDRMGKIVTADFFRFAVARFNYDGSPDSTFGNNGSVLIPVGNVSECYAMAIQPDNKIVLVGRARLNTRFDFTIVRLNPDGSPDSSFGNGGIVISNINDESSQATALDFQPDGKIVVVGFSIASSTGRYKFTVARYHQNGSLDMGFGQNGKVTTNILFYDFAHSIAVQRDGKIIVGGYSFASGGDDFSLVRYNSDGSLDETFGDGGKMTNSVGNSFDRAYHIAVQKDGKIILGGDCFTETGYNSCLARYHTNGRLDMSFGSDGLKIAPLTSGQNYMRALLLQTNGKIIIVAHGYNGTINQIAIARFNPDSSFDASFGNGGKVVTSFNGTHTSAYTGALQSDGKILASGYLTSSSLNRVIIRYEGDPVTQSLPPKFCDFDGDRKSDISVFRPSNGFWYWLNSSDNSFSAAQFGASSDKSVPADYDGDGKTDFAVFRNGNWYILQSSNNSFSAQQFGLSGDVPTANDYDGDGKADVAVFRQGNWYILNSANGSFRAGQFGIASDKPVVGDFDGDGKADLTVFRRGIWYVLGSTDGFSAASFGLADDRPVAADYDGDGKTDFAVYRPSNGTWYLQRSSAGFGAAQFGISTDQPTPADYDGDGQTDLGVYRDGTWYLLQTTDGFRAVQFGLVNDIPAPSAFLP